MRARIWVGAARVAWATHVAFRVIAAGLAISAAVATAANASDKATPAKNASTSGSKTVAPKPAPPKPPPASPLILHSPGAFDAAPYHGSLDAIAWGGHGELRFAMDRKEGVTEPEWFSVGRVNGFFLAKLGAKLRLAGQGQYDRAADDFTLERAELIARIGRTMDAHGGIFLVPLGRTNLDHDAPQDEFSERSFVATQLVGVPNAQMGVGVRGVTRLTPATPLTYEIDLVTGFDDGIIMDAAGGTRLPAGRNNYGDQNGLPALAARVAIHPSVTTEIGLAAQSGPYNQTKVGGVTVDKSRFVHLVVADAETRAGKIRLAGELGTALIDVPPALEALYAEKQWGASVEAARTLRAPIFARWKGTSLGAALRADMVDFDMGVRGDSRARLSASLNVHPMPSAVLRFGWYYEIQRDRFDNDTPFAGLTFTAASYF